MPKAGRAAKKGGKGGLIIGIVVVVVLLGGAGVGGYFWNRSSALATATQYMDAAMGLFKTGQPDAAILKAVLAKDQVARVDQGEGPLFDIAKGPFSRFLTMITAAYTIGESEIGMSEATVNATLTASVMQRQVPLAVKIALVREGLAWKVDEKNSQISMPGSGGGGEAPRL